MSPADWNYRGALLADGHAARRANMPMRVILLATVETRLLVQRCTSECTVLQ
jgi:hypothetical protein